jgi:DNA repair exonuclease SbcCD ATPase subunit
MHFEQFNIAGFGCLRTSVDLKPGMVNLAIAENEAGKSTLVAALLAAFYGIEDDERRRQSIRPHRRYYTPWMRPEEFGVTLVFHDGKRRWRLTRDFHNRITELVDANTGKDFTAKYQKGRGADRIGEELLGLSCEDFLKSFYLKQEELIEFRDSGGLVVKVQQAATSREGEATSESALERMRQALRRYPHPSSKEGLTIENVVKRYQQEIGGLRNDLERLERERSDSEPLCRRLEEIEREVEQRKRQREEDQTLGDLAEIRELNRIVDTQQRLRKEYGELQTAAVQLKEYERFPADKSEQLNQIVGRVEELSRAVAKQEDAIRSKVDAPLEELESYLQAHQRYVSLSERDLFDLETTYSRLSDRQERLESARNERDQRIAELQRQGFEADQFARLKETVAGFTPEETSFVEDFRATYAEEEAVYREAKTRREWLERQRDLIFDRRRRILSNSRLFFIMAAVMAIAGGLMMLLTQGTPNTWIGSVLAGLGATFGAVGFIVRGTAGSLESSGLKRMDVDLEVAVGDEEKIKGKLDAIAGQLTGLAKRAGYTDGNELMTQYASFVRLEKLTEPLFAAERDFKRAESEAAQAREQIKPFFDRVGEPTLDGARLVDTARELLNAGREAVHKAEEYRQLKTRHDQLSDDLEKLQRDLRHNHDVAADILRLGGVTVTEPLPDAVTTFKQALEKHQRYRSIAAEQLPRVESELLPEVDLAAKSDRLEQLTAKVPRKALKLTPEHTKEFYRDQADRAIHEIDALNTEKMDINRKIGVLLDKYQTSHPTLQRQLSEAEGGLERAERFRAEVELAIGILTDISQEVYRSWAVALSEEATPFLGALNPRYTDLKFSDDLTFTIQDKQTQRAISSGEVDSILSSGARDEVFLAARLAISSYLASGAKGAIPILLDEPLASVDDDKFLSGMKFFMDTLSRKHQVLILSCHTERHRWLERRLPTLYGERVHIIKLTTVA